MDMSKYSGAAFLKIGDVKNGPIRVVIALSKASMASPI
jgi:hypothetical protein